MKINPRNASCRPVPGIYEECAISGKRKATLDGFVFAIYIPHARLRKRSWQLDERIARCYISPALGDMVMEEISPADVEAWQTGLIRAGLSAGSCNRFLATLKTIFSLAETWGRIPFGASPIRHISPLRNMQTRVRCLTAREGRELMARLKMSDAIQARALELIVLTGARKNEILKARWEYIDASRHILKVPVSKSGKTRYVILSDAAMEIIGRITRMPGCPWLFPGKKSGKPLGDIYIFWDEIRRELGLDDVRIHDLRHTFASYLVNKGHSLYEIQKLLGHADPRTTMRYAHLGIGQLVTAAETVGSLLAPERQA